MSSAPQRSRTSYLLHQFGLIGGLVLTIGGLLGCYLILFPLLGGIILGMLMTSRESELHTVVSPDKAITALVIADGCGATCGCTTRVDVKTNDDYVEEVWRGIDVCDAKINWISSTAFYILADNGQQVYIDIATLEYSP